MRTRILASLCAAVFAMLLSVGLVAAAEPSLGTDAAQGTLTDSVADTGAGGTAAGTTPTGDQLTVKVNDDGDTGDVNQSNSNESDDATNDVLRETLARLRVEL